MKILFLKEAAIGEKRSSLSPDLVKKYHNLGWEVFFEEGAGEGSSFSNKEFTNLEAKSVKKAEKVIGDMDVIVKINAIEGEEIENVISKAKKDAILISNLALVNDKDKIEKISALGVKIIIPTLFPRISRAQTIDVLSSQSNLSGYRAVIEAAAQSSKVFPMMMTSAGTISPAKIMVIGSGVAGLQAIATAKRLGAVVIAFDVRPAAKEQVESLGARFIEVKNEDSLEDKGGYAKETSEDYKKRQNKALYENIIKQDIIITTALIPNAPAPKIIDDKMVNGMKNGSVIIDLAAINGGNCSQTKPGEIVLSKSGVKIVGDTNIISKSSSDASRLYAKNIFNFITLITDKDKKEVILDKEDEIIKASLVE
jgi:NAD(P) transhydrogenase subunit alpha